MGINSTTNLLRLKEYSTRFLSYLEHIAGCLSDAGRSKTGENGSLKCYTPAFRSRSSPNAVQPLARHLV